MRRGQGYGYAPSGGGTRFFESAVPLVLIVILAVFIAGKLGVVDFSEVPVLNSVFPAPKTVVAVVGRSSATMRDLMASEDFRALGVYFAGDIDQKVVYPGALRNFDIVMAMGDPFCDRVARKVIADRVKAGGKLIVIGDACTRVNDDRSAVGWDIGIGSLGDVMPVKIGGVSHELDPWVTAPVTGKLKIVEVDHPMFNGVKNFQFNSVITGITVPTTNSNILAYVDSSSIGIPTRPALFAIIESRGLLAGKVIYYAYDPSTMAQFQQTGRNMFLNALLYLRGAKG